MKKLKFLKYLIVITLTLTIYITLTSQKERTYTVNIYNDPKFTLTTDFNKKIDTRYWNLVEKGSNYNNELQYYHPSNAYILDNYLTIKAAKEEINNHKYKSGMITTKGKFEFLYGKVIFKARPAVGKGLLTAIWLLPSDESLLPEIDIIEILGDKPREVWMGVHYIEGESKSKYFHKYTKPKLGFDIYELVWEKEEIRWYINGQLVHKTNKGIPDKKMYLIICLAVGGDWPKNPDDSILPSTFLLDYITIIPKDTD